MITPVLLSGGVGSRLWPVSREAHPKQFLSLAGELSMLQETLRRTDGKGALSPKLLGKRLTSLRYSDGTPVMKDRVL